MRSYDVMLLFVILWFVDFIALTVILLKERNDMELGRIMKLKNKETGEIVEITMPITNGDGWNIKASSLAELCKEWEDYKPKELWFIAHDGSICSSRSNLFTKEWQKLGLTFETKEEAEKAVEKLLALERLKEKKFRFDGYDVANRVGDDVICGRVYFKGGEYDREEIEDDLFLLFGGVE